MDEREAGSVASARRVHDTAHLTSLITVVNELGKTQPDAALTMRLLTQRRSLGRPRHPHSSHRSAVRNRGFLRQPPSLRRTTSSRLVGTERSSVDGAAGRRGRSDG